MFINIHRLRMALSKEITLPQNEFVTIKCCYSVGYFMNTLNSMELHNMYASPNSVR
jgi:hypothetical protein